MGECPVLTSSFAARFVSHFQATGLARPATASHDTYLRASSACKHYAAYDLENWKGMDRFHFNAVVTPRDWRDTYEPIFRSCVVDANVSAIMCSCNVSRHDTCIAAIWVAFFSRWQRYSLRAGRRLLHQ